MSFPRALAAVLAATDFADLLRGASDDATSRRMEALGPAWEPWWWLAAADDEAAQAATSEPWGGWTYRRRDSGPRSPASASGKGASAQPQAVDRAGLASAHPELNLAHLLFEGLRDPGVRGGPGAVRRELVAVVADPVASWVTVLWGLDVDCLPAACDDGEDRSVLGPLARVPEQVYAWTEKREDLLAALPSVQLVVACDHAARGDPRAVAAHQRVLRWREQTLRGIGRTVPNVDLSWAWVVLDAKRATTEQQLLAHHLPLRYWVGLGRKEAWWEAPQDDLDRPELALEDLAALGNLRASADEHDREGAWRALQSLREHRGFRTPDVASPDFALRERPLTSSLLEAEIRVRHWARSPSGSLHLKLAPLTLIAADNAGGKTTQAEALHAADHGFARARLDPPPGADEWGTQPARWVVQLRAADAGAGDGAGDVPAIAALFGTDVDIARGGVGERELFSLLINNRRRGALARLFRLAYRLAKTEAELAHVEVRRELDWTGWASRYAAAMADDTTPRAPVTPWLGTRLPEIIDELDGWKSSLQGPDALRQRAVIERAQDLLTPGEVADVAPVLIAEALAVILGRSSEVWLTVTDQDGRRNVDDLRDFVDACGYSDSAVALLRRFELDVVQAFRERLRVRVADVAAELEQGCVYPLREWLCRYLVVEPTSRPNTGTLVSLGHAERLARTLTLSTTLWHPLVVDDAALGQDTAHAARTVLKFASIAQRAGAVLRNEFFAGDEWRRLRVAARVWKPDGGQRSVDGGDPGEPATAQEHTASPPNPFPMQAQAILSSYQLPALELVANHLGAVLRTEVRRHLDQLIPVKWHDALCRAAATARRDYLQLVRRDLAAAGFTGDASSRLQYEACGDDRGRVPAAAIRLLWPGVSLPELKPDEEGSRWYAGACRALGGLGLERLRLDLRRRASVSLAAAARALVHWLVSHDLLPVVAMDGAPRYIQSSLSVLYLPSIGGLAPQVGPTRILRFGAFGQQLAPREIADSFGRDDTGEDAPDDVGPPSPQTMIGDRLAPPSPPSSPLDSGPAVPAGEPDNEETPPPEPGPSAVSRAAPERKRPEAPATTESGEAGELVARAPARPSRVVDITEPEPAGRESAGSEIALVAADDAARRRPGRRRVWRVRAVSDEPREQVWRVAADPPAAEPGVLAELEQIARGAGMVVAERASEADVVVTRTDAIEDRWRPENASIERRLIGRRLRALRRRRQSSVRVGVGTRRFELVPDDVHFLLTSRGAGDPDTRLLSEHDWVGSLVAPLVDLRAALEASSGRGAVEAGTEPAGWTGVHFLLQVELSVAITIGGVFNHLTPWNVSCRQGNLDWPLDRTTATVESLAAGPVAVERQTASRHGVELDALLSFTVSALAGRNAWRAAQMSEARQVAHLVKVTPADGPRQDAVSNGPHAVALGDAAVRATARARPPRSVATRVFFTGPAALALAVGRSLPGLGRVVLMEYGRSTGTYYQAAAMSV